MIEYILNNSVTLGVCLLILIFAVFYFWNLIVIGRFNTQWGKTQFDGAISDIETNNKLGSIYAKYKSTIIFPDDKGVLKSDLSAEDFFNTSSVLRSLNVNHRAMASASSILVGLGLLGTFLGLTLGVQQFDSSSTESIQNSINALLSGMGTAFITSLIGMGFSTAYILLEKRTVNKMGRRIDAICANLDSKYYISQPEKYALIYQRKDQQFIDLFTSKSSTGELITPANLLRDIYEENQKQTRALNGFTEDLMYDIMNRSVSESLTPLVAEVKNVTDTLSEKLEEFAQKVQNPGENMAEGIVKELKESISSLLTELQTSISSIAGDKIDGLNTELQGATAALALFPDKMESMMNSLSDHFSNINHLVDKMVKESSSINDGNVAQMQSQMESISGMLNSTTLQFEELITSISDKSQETNSSIIKQMQDQISYSTTNMNNLTNTIQEVMTKINQQTEDASSNILRRQEQIQERSNQVLEKFTESMSTVMQEAVSKFNKQAEESSANMMVSQEVMQQQTTDANNALVEQMKSQLDHNTSSMSGLVSLVQDTITKLNAKSEEVSGNILTNQELSQAQTDAMLSSFNNTVSDLENLVSNIKNTITQFTTLQQEANKSTSSLSEMSRNALSSTVNLRDAQTQFIEEVKSNAERNLTSIESLNTALVEAKDLPQEYAQKFGTIRDALAVIFDGINNGLKEYSRTVKGSTEEILETYTSSMTDAINKLSVAISDLGDMVEDLGNIKRKY